jgi:hypothetical protein
MVQPFTLIFVFDLSQQKLEAIQNIWKHTIFDHSLRSHLNQHFVNCSIETFIYKNQLMCMFRLF